jgi:mono/diheme cytochrome c family protein
MGAVLYTHWLIRGVMTFVALYAAPIYALAADAAKGEIIAKRWCAACHLVSPEQTRAVADVPSFAAVARMKLPPERLKSFLMDPHPIMPNMNLTRSEIDDIVAYIRSLNQ